MCEARKLFSPLTAMFSLIVRAAGTRPHHGQIEGKATAHVALLVLPDHGRACVLMVDGGFGASLTNTAEEIVDFVARKHLAAPGMVPDQILWLYRDSTGHWDELLVSQRPGGNVEFRHFHGGQDAVLTKLHSEGFALDEVHLSCLAKHLRLQ